MTKPPKATPHSDVEGVHRDERRNTQVAAELGQSADTVEQAKRRSTGRPRLSDEPPTRDDRSR